MFFGSGRAVLDSFWGLHGKVQTKISAVVVFISGNLMSQPDLFPETKSNSTLRLLKNMKMHGFASARSRALL